ncbi:serine/threonine-protein kinase Chk1-like [Oratosquilla oratoria]|uniref:serine/threonine-protein kinase Chk1-like n=1 Tax=Oratosquilla oratoria TaxID=337810 RepID=UPI003F75E74A
MSFPSDVLQRNEERVRRHEGTKTWKEVKVLGQGTFGRVTLIKNKGNNERMAFKKVDLEDGASTIMEEVIHSQLSHTNIVQLFFWKNEGRNLHMYLEYCRLGSLEFKVLDMTEEGAEDYIDQLVADVGYLHSRGVVHRDIKPTNLLIGEKETLKIADMGLSCVYISEGKEMVLTGFAGTPAFMAPEQLARSPYRGPPVDIWSCGMVLFTVLTSARPWVKAHLEDSGFKHWMERDKKYVGLGPWERLRETSHESLVFGLLAIDPSQRLSTWNDYVKKTED